MANAPAKNIYLYNDPFLYPDSKINRQMYEIEHVDADDRKEIAKLHGILFKFAVDNDLVEVEGNTVTSSMEQDTGSWAYLINWTNFRSLTVMAEYSKIMSSLGRDSNRALSLILDLHVRLGCLFDERILNVVVNRVMSSVSIIPYEVPKGDSKILWSKIHKDTPFMWVIILLQVVIRSEGQILK